MNAIQNSLRVTWWAIVISVFALSCKSTKAPVVINDEVEKAGREQEAMVHKQKEEQLKKREDELRKMDEEIMRRNAMIESPKKLAQYFDSIVNSKNSATNNNISQALTLFASSNAPVMVVIHDKNGKKNYTRTLTIAAYLIYLKGQKSSVDRIEHIAVNEVGKITELELMKSELHSAR